jgi:hypothetical protein
MRLKDALKADKPTDANVDVDGDSDGLHFSDGNNSGNADGASGDEDNGEMSFSSEDLEVEDGIGVGDLKVGDTVHIKAQNFDGNVQKAQQRWSYGFFGRGIWQLATVPCLITSITDDEASESKNYVLQPEELEKYRPGIGRKRGRIETKQLGEVRCNHTKFVAEHVLERAADEAAAIQKLQLEHDRAGEQRRAAREGDEEIVVPSKCGPAYKAGEDSDLELPSDSGDDGEEEALLECDVDISESDGDAEANTMQGPIQPI